MLCFSLIRIFDFSIKAYTNSALTILERQFRLSSTESGLFAILNDIAQVSLIVFVSYLATNITGHVWLELVSSLQVRIDNCLFFSEIQLVGSDVQAYFTVRSSNNRASDNLIP